MSSHALFDVWASIGFERGNFRCKNHTSGIVIFCFMPVKLNIVQSKTNQPLLHYVEYIWIHVIPNLPYLHPRFTGDHALVVGSLTLFTSTFSCFGGSVRIFPSGPRGFLFQPVSNNGPSLKRGNGCASVLMTTLSNGRKSFGEKSR